MLIISGCCTLAIPSMLTKHVCSISGFLNHFHSVSTTTQHIFFIRLISNTFSEQITWKWTKQERKKNPEHIKQHTLSYLELCDVCTSFSLCRVRCNRNRLSITHIHIPIQTIYSKNFENAIIYLLRKRLDLDAIAPRIEQSKTVKWTDTRVEIHV